MKKVKLSLMAMMMCLLVFTSCKKDNPPAPENENEEIKEATLTFTNITDKKVVTMTAKKKEGSNDYEIKGGTLNLGATYDLVVSLDKEVEEEIAKEADVHQFYFSFGDWVSAFAYKDADTNGKPIGLKSQITVSDKDEVKGAHTLQVVLKHEPDKTKNNEEKPYMYDSTIGGSTDLSLTFDVAVDAAL